MSESSVSGVADGRVGHRSSVPRLLQHKEEPDVFSPIGNRGGSLESHVVGLCLVGDRGLQLEARTDPELLIRAAEVVLDGLLGHEQRLRDLSVAAPVRGLAADPPLRRGQGTATGQFGSRASPRPCVQLRSRTFSERDGTTLVGQLDRPTLGVASLPSPSNLSQLTAQISERVSQLEARRAVLEDRDRFLEQRQPLASVDRQRGCSQGHSQRTGRTHLSSRSHLLVGKPRSRLLLAERGERRSCSRSPLTWPQHAIFHESVAAPLQVGDALARVTVGDSQPGAGDQEVRTVGEILGHPEHLAHPHQVVRRRELTAFDVHHDRHRGELWHNEVRWLDKQ